MSDDQRRSPAGRPRYRVTVLGAFTVTSPHGAAMTIDVDARRLIGYLAVHPRPQQRAGLVRDLWPGVDADTGARLLADAVDAVDVPGLVVSGPEDSLCLAEQVDVDLAEALALVRALPELPDDELPGTALLTADILPDWTAPWIAVERERYRQIRLAALEQLSARLSMAGRHDDAIAAAQEAVRAAPSRESARRALIEAYLAQGEVTAAVAQYDEYQELLRSSVGGPVLTGLDALLPPGPFRPVQRARQIAPRSAVMLPRLHAVRRVASTSRRLVAGGSVPSATR